MGVTMRIPAKPGKEKETPGRSILIDGLRFIRLAGGTVALERDRPGKPQIAEWTAEQWARIVKAMGELG